MNNSIFESIFAVFDDKPPFLSILDTFWPIFGHFSYSTSINHSLTIELNNILNWITRVYFELNNILNWILGKAILNRILNESFFGKIQILNWIRLGIVHHYIRFTWALFGFLMLQFTPLASMVLLPRATFVSTGVLLDSPRVTRAPLSPMWWAWLHWKKSDFTVSPWSTWG